MSEPVRSLYVHVPFCRNVCGYCDFYKRPLQGRAVGPLVDAIGRELDNLAGRVPLALDTIFVGGGTPTVLPPNELMRLLTLFAPHIDRTANVEFTVEANPATVDDAVAGVLAAAGINRVSMGAQSFDLQDLRRLERTHRPEDVPTTIATCRRAGIQNVNVDLIFGIPDQSLDTWRRNLEMVIALGVEHLSCYGLTYEPGTRLRAQLEVGRVQRLDEDLEADLYELMLDVLGAAGFEQYEISNFARPGRACRHNLRYWRNEAYLGLGPSAAGYVGGSRYKNVPDTAAYVAAMQHGTDAAIEREQLSPAGQARETAMLNLRLTRGIDRRAFRARFGADPAQLFAEVVAPHVADGLLEVDEVAIRLTRRGLLLANVVMRDFV